MGVTLHFVGPLQTNKVKHLSHLVDVIHTVDRESLAQKIRRYMDAHNTWNPQCFVQVNTGSESQKSGVLPKQADDFIAVCRQKYHLNVVGLMCIPPIDAQPALHFALLRKIAHRNALENLSMGMSATYPLAIQFDATHVRVGSAIFGARKSRINEDFLIYS